MKYSNYFVVIIFTYASYSIWSFDFVQGASKLTKAVFNSGTVRKDVKVEEAYKQAPEKLMNYSISQGLARNKENDHEEGLKKMIFATFQSKYKSSKAYYFLAKQYLEMSLLPGNFSKAENFRKQAAENFKKSIALESNLEYAENRQWANAARKMLEKMQSKEIKLSSTDMNILASIAVLESGQNCSEERLDIVQSVFNRINSGQFPNTVQSVTFAANQFEPFFHIGPQTVNTETGAASHISKERGMSYEQALNAIRQVKNDVGDEIKMKAAKTFVGGRTFFKGQSEYDHRVAAEDPLRKQGCNFHHIEPDTQTYAELKALEVKGPSSIKEF